MISIIIPTLNEASAILKTLKSFRAGSRHRFEIIVSDGGSQDDTVMIAKTLADKVLSKSGSERQTIAMGRNAGAREATGEYLAFFDADVTIVNIDEFFDKVLQFFERHEDAIALTGHLRVLPEYETLGDGFFFSLVSYVHLIENNLLRVGAASGEFQIVRRSVFEKLGGYREDLAVAEDQEFFRRLAKVGRTYFHRGLTVYHTGRRAHAIGWPRLLAQWLWNDFYVRSFGRSYNKVWKEIR